ncbi:hypothetical protein D5086_021611 [Populus alba]|uniref:Uncharacterized protein n=1 Tax=Populus alba TaxID=43335 RepID=A0ACC4BCN7_POPAL
MEKGNAICKARSYVDLLTVNKGSLGAFLKRKGALERIAAVRLALDIARLIEECWHENKAKRLTFRQILTRLDTVHNSMAHKRAERFLLSLNMCQTTDMLSESVGNVEERS